MTMTITKSEVNFGIRTQFNHKKTNEFEDDIIVFKYFVFWRPRKPREASNMRTVRYRYFPGLSNDVNHTVMSRGYSLSRPTPAVRIPFWHWKSRYRSAFCQYRIVLRSDWILQYRKPFELVPYSKLLLLHNFPLITRTR
jgi:hypothetical protein